MKPPLPIAAALIALATLFAAGASPTAPSPLIISGQTVPLQTVEIPSIVRGQITQIFVREGQPIKKGDPIAQLDDQMQRDVVALARLEAESSVEIRAAQEQVDFARNQLDRFQKIGSSGSVSELRSLELAVTQAQLSLEQKTQNQEKKRIDLDREQALLDRMTIRSPLDGSILRLNKRPGEQVDTDKPLAVIVQTARLNIRFYPPKPLFGKVKAGDAIAIELQTDPPRTRQATIVSVDPVVDASQLFQVKMELDNADQSIPAGVPALWLWK